MRILQAVHALPPSTYGGTELYTRDLAGALASAGHEVAVATPRGEGADLDGAEVFELPGPRSTGVQDDLGLPTGPVDPRVDERFAEVLDWFDPDVVHLQHLKGLSATLPALCRDGGVACLLTLHDFWTICHREQLARPDGRRCSGPESVGKCTDCLLASEDGPGDVGPVGVAGPTTDGSDTSDDLRSHYADGVALRRTQLRRALAATDELIAPSAFLREVFVDHGAAPASITHLRNGIEVDRFDDTGFDPDAPLRVGYAGRIAPEKGVHLLLDAFASVVDDRGSGADAELHVFGQFDPGSDEYHSGLAERAGNAVAPDADGRGEAPADGRVRFHGRYDHRADPYRGMDVLVLPSTWYENSPLVIQEAFAAGVPVVAGDVGGMAELVTHGADGLTFEAGSPAALATRIESLAENPELVSRLRDGVGSPKQLDEHAAELVDRYEACATEETDATVGAGKP